jgi:predicted Na+-dependent transporter
MSATFDDVMYVWRRPGTLLRSLVAMYVAVPTVALAMAYFLPIVWGAKAAIVVLALCAGAPLLPKKLLKLGGDPAYAFSLTVATSIVAIATIPLGLRLLSGQLGLETGVKPGDVALLILESLLIPLGAGMLVHAVSPDFGEYVGERLLRVASAVLVVGTTLVLGTSWRLLLDLGSSTFLAFVLFASASLGLGHVLGGPDPGERTSLAAACMTRHVGLALLVAASYRSNPRTLALVLAYLVTSALILVPYLRWRTKSREGVPAFA